MMRTKPNILIIMPDTWRGDTLACAGHPVARTPNLDRLAGIGVRFDNAYTSSPVCMPARTNCMSGLYCHNTGQWSNFGCFPLEATTYMEVLQKNGYRTAHIGKSHFYPHRNAVSGASFHMDEKKEFLHRMGHDDVLETTGPLATVGTRSILTDRWQQKGLLERFRDDYRKRSKAGVFKATWPSPLPETEHMDTFVCQTAIDYLQNRDTRQPFAVFVGIGGPHDPWDPPQNWADKWQDVQVPEPLPPSAAEPWLGEAARSYHDQEMGTARAPEIWQAIRRLYYAKIEHIDDQIGRMMDVLKETGDLDNTVILFWSDHGDRLCDRGKCSKGVFYDESARIPIILRLPGNPGAGGVCKSVVSINDIFATLLEAAGIEGVDSFGTSLVPATQNPSTVFHSAVFSEIGGRQHRQTMIRTERYKMVVGERAETLQFFDMHEDPDERVNLAGRQDMAGLEQELKTHIFRWRLQTETVQ